MNPNTKQTIVNALPYLFAAGVIIAVYLGAAAAIRIVLPNAREVWGIFPVLVVILLLADKLSIRK